MHTQLEVPIGTAGAIRQRDAAPVERARPSTSLWYELATRVLDIALSILALVLLAPVFLVIALLVKLDSPGPVLFKQVRIGRNRRRDGGAAAPQAERRNEDLFGEPFVLYKFRSMFADSRTRFPELYSYNHSEEEMRTLPIKILVGRKCEAAALQTRAQLDLELVGDPRITRFGRWLRKTSVDELPNFVNVLKGDMHLVGPRPDIAENIRHYSERHLAKLEVKPGITGLAQVNGRGRLSFDQTNEYDVLYLRKRSLIVDLRILLKTMLVWVRKDGAF